MSKHRENIVWQDRSGKWSMGIYDFHYVGMGTPDFDPEWDVEYDTSRFSWVTARKYETAEAAQDEWRKGGGANVGGHTVQAWDEGQAASAQKLDEMREACLIELRAEQPGHGMGI